MNNQKSYGAKEVAKIIKKELGTMYPNTKFSVTSKDSINVNWTDGPTTDEIRSIISKYKSKGFDGMIDLEYYYRHYEMPDGTIHLWGSEGTSGSISS